MDPLAHSQLLIDSLIDSNLLVQQLAEYPAFDRSKLSSVKLEQPLNFEQKLGHLYEDALRIVLESSASCQLVANNIQVFRLRGDGPARDTLGELDYLLKIADTHIHLELAVKFYLSVPSAGEVKWPGPDARDNWDRKRLRLADHQFKISQVTEAKQMLQEQYQVTQLETCHLIYGCLFDPIDGSTNAAQSVASDCARGKWLKRDQWEQWAPSGQLWAVPKHLWPVPPSESLLLQLEKATKADMMELSQDRCSMFTDGKTRYFLVSQHWCELVGV